MKNEIVTNHVVHLMSVFIQCSYVSVDNFEQVIRMVTKEVHEVLNQDYVSTTKD